MQWLIRLRILPVFFVELFLGSHWKVKRYERENVHSEKGRFKPGVLFLRIR